MIVLILVSLSSASQYGLGEYIGGGNKHFTMSLNPAAVNLSKTEFTINGIYEYTESGGRGFGISSLTFSIPFKGVFGAGVFYEEIFDMNYSYELDTDTLSRDIYTEYISSKGDISRYAAVANLRWKMLSVGGGFSILNGAPIEVWRIDFQNTPDVQDSLIYKFYGYSFIGGIIIGNQNRIGGFFRYPESVIYTYDNISRDIELPGKYGIEVEFTVPPIKNTRLSVLYMEGNRYSLMLSVKGLSTGYTYSSAQYGHTETEEKFLNVGYTIRFKNNQQIGFSITMGEATGKFPDRIIKGVITLSFNEEW
jgi:hypothetical protein